MSDETLSFDLDELKVREIEEIEELAGASIDELFGEGKPKGKALRLVAYIVKKRDDPTFTLEQAGELTIRLAEPDGNGSAPLPNGS